MMRIVCLVVILLNIVRIKGASVNLLYPKGFSISVASDKNVENVDFEVNITRNGDNAIANYFKTVHQNFGHRYSFSKRNLMLNLGDVISYRISTNLNNSVQRIMNGICHVRELPKMGVLRKHGWLFNYDVNLSDGDCSDPFAENAAPISILQAPRINLPNQDMALKLNNCEQAVFNTSITLLSLQLEVEELRNLTKEIKEFEEAYPLAKQLTISGRIPPDGDAVETVKFMLNEKLDLRPTVVSAFRDSPYNIRFTVSTIIEKFQILEAAKFMLAETRIQIS